MKQCFHTRRKSSQHGEQGYILLALLLIVAVMGIVALAALPSFKFSMQRDREEEMIHRGAQYSNAIRRFYKKFGRYPTKIEDLENSNNIKFLRKRYKDPMNCKAGKCADFKLLYYADAQSQITGFGGGVGGMIPGMSSAGGLAGAATSGGLGQNSSFGQNSFGQSSPFGGSSSSSFGGNSSSSSFGQNQQGPGQNQTNTPAGSDPSQTGTPGTPGTGTDDSSSATGANSSSPFGQSGNGQSSNQLGASGQVIGGPIVGVATALKSDDPTIREFNHKKKYKDWLFVYDPSQDRGQLITTPYQPLPQGAMQNVNGATPAGGLGQPGGQPGSPNGSGFGSSGFGNSGFGNSGNSNSGFGNSNPQPSTPPAQAPQ